jgi:HEAT repeat protein
MSTPAAFLYELTKVGLSIQDPWDLVNSRRSHREAIPVLIEWLERAEYEVQADEREKFREALVRSLAVKEARGVAAPAMLREFRRSGVSSEYRWTIGNTLAVVADDSVFVDVVEVARDRSYGRDRQMVVLALARMKNPHTVDVLTEQLDDETVVGHALMALGQLKASQAEAAIEQCLRHPKPWVRKEAKKALAKIRA